MCFIERASNYSRPKNTQFIKGLSAYIKNYSSKLLQWVASDWGIQWKSKLNSTVPPHKYIGFISRNITGAYNRVTFLLWKNVFSYHGGVILETYVNGKVSTEHMDLHKPTEHRLRNILSKNRALNCFYRVFNRKQYLRLVVMHTCTIIWETDICNLLLLVIKSVGQ